MQTRTWPNALLAIVCLASCSQEAPPQAPKQTAAAGGAPVAASQATLAPQATPDEESEEGEADPGRPSTEHGMYGYEYEIMPFPPPLGPNGQSRTFEAASTSAYGFTGDVTFSLIGEVDYTTEHDVRMQGANGMSYDLAVVGNGGVNAIGTIDWSKVMMQPVGMADYLKADEKSDIKPGTLVFVFKVIKIGKTGKPSEAPGCGNDGYIAITAPSDDSWDTATFVIAAFSPGPWPPADSSRHCGTFLYGPAELSDAKMSLLPR
jgi:hypothetical protein